MVEKFSEEQINDFREAFHVFDKGITFFKLFNSIMEVLYPKKLMKYQRWRWNNRCKRTGYCYAFFRTEPY